MPRDATTPSKLQRALGWLMLLVGIAVFAIRLQHPGPYAMPRGGNLLGGVGALVAGACLLAVGPGAPRLTSAFRWLAVAASPVVLFLALYAVLAEVEEVVVLKANDASGRPADLRLWVVDLEATPWVTMPRRKAEDHGLDGARIGLLRRGELHCGVAIRVEDRDRVNDVHRMRHEKYAVQRLATAIGLFERTAGDETVALRLDPCPSEAGTRPASEDTSRLFTRNREARFGSQILGGELTVLPGVFWPKEAEGIILPMMRENAAVFPGRSVLEIGTGSGAAGIYAAKLGASRVVVTDINPNAVASARINAEAFGVADVLEARLVPGDDISAFAVIRPDETFDIILSNPPYSLDLEAPKNDAVTDTGDLGFSIVDGLDQHLEPGGFAMLFYGSLFYHLVMEKYAVHSGFEVRSHRPFFMTQWEASVLFNSYLEKLLEHRGLDPDALRFSYLDEDLIILLKSSLGEEPALFDEVDSDTHWGGWMVIRRAAATKRLAAE